jgi:REP element-mobilizing transposase RayT
MPNHLHFIVWLKPVAAPLAGAHPAVHASAKHAGEKPPTNAGASPAATRLSDVVGAYKSFVARRWLDWIRQNAPDRDGRVWQRNYYEHVIRDEDELNRVREYILNNPLQWRLDRENPDSIPDAAYQRDWGWLENLQESRR